MNLSSRPLPDVEDALQNNIKVHGMKGQEGGVQGCRIQGEYHRRVAEQYGHCWAKRRGCGQDSVVSQLPKMQ